mgnify:CR=1 FL=1|tara:strand:+ start:1920 stop:3353 length:1434 start_codon:yes stop_codon:yes gene_type:complete
MAVKDSFFNLGNNPNLDAADTGIDPATGKILTPAERKQIFKSRILSKQNRQAIARTSKMNFGGGGALVLSGKGAIEEQRVQAEGGALVAPVNDLTKRVDALESSVANMQKILINIRKVIIKGNETETKIQEELAKQQSLFLENRVKEQRETELEEPDLEKKAKKKVDDTQKKTVGFFGRIKNALLALFGGFIAQKVFQTFSAWQDGNSDLLKALGIDLNSALQQVTRGFHLFSRFTSKLVTLAARFAQGVGSFATRVVSYPFRVASNVIQTAVRKAYIGIQRAIGPGMRKAIKGFFGIGGRKVTQEVVKKGVQKTASKVAARGIFGSLPIIGTGLDIWGAVSEGMKGNWAGAGLYTAGAITSLIPGMQAFSGVLSVSAMGQSIHNDLKRDASGEGIDFTGDQSNLQIDGRTNNNFQNLGQVDRPKPIITLVNSNNSGQQVTGQGNNSAKNTIPNIPSNNRDNLYAMNTKSEFNTPVN